MQFYPRSISLKEIAMNELLSKVIDAHDSRKRWNHLQKITAQMSVSGAIWPFKGWPGALEKVQVSIDPHKPYVEYAPFLKSNQIGTFHPDRTAIVTQTGDLIEERRSPRLAFSGHTRATPWDAQHLLYFAGYAIWTYLTTPHLFNHSGIQSIELEPWEEEGETWRRLKVIFPKDFPSHSAEQIFYFDANGMLCRHDYSVDVMGGTASANYASEYRDISGLIFPTRRRVYAIGPDNRPLLDRVFVAIDIHDISLE